MFVCVLSVCLKSILWICKYICDCICISCLSVPVLVCVYVSTFNDNKRNTQLKQHKQRMMKYTDQQQGDQIHMYNHITICANFVYLYFVHYFYGSKSEMTVISDL